MHIYRLINGFEEAKDSEENWHMHMGSYINGDETRCDMYIDSDIVLA